MSTQKWVKYSVLVAGMALALSLSAAQALASDSDGMDTPAGMPMHPPGMGHPDQMHPKMDPDKMWGMDGQMKWRQFGHHKNHGWMKLLGLTPEQHNKIKDMRAANRAATEKLHADMRANRMAMQTTAPTDPGYTVLVTKAKELAAARVQAQADFKARVYKEVLTDEQRAFAQSLMKHMKVVEANRPKDHAWKSHGHGESDAPMPMSQHVE